MDKNTVTGFILIFAVMIGFYFINKPSEEQIARQKAYNDSIALVQQQQKQQTLQPINQTTENKVEAPPNVVKEVNTFSTEEQKNIFGDFSASAIGTEETFDVESELLKLTFSNKGGLISAVQLKKYRTHDSLPLFLFEKNESQFEYIIPTKNNRVIKSSDLYFSKVGEVQTDDNGTQTVTLRLNTNNPEAYIDYIYTIPKDNYMIRYEVKANNMNTIMPLSTNSLDMSWASKLRQQERGYQFENRYSGLYYKYKADDDVDDLSQSKDDKETLDSQVKWIAFKDQFFSSILIAKNGLSSVELESTMEEENSGFLKSLSSNMRVGFDPTGREKTEFNFYFGPNDYRIFKAYDKKEFKKDKLYFRKLIPLGFSFISWINRILIIPIFNFLNGFISSYGLIILLLTLFIKLLIFPLTYKSYMSSAKMRVLQPEIQEINNRIPADKAMERQQATMALYKKVGVNPMSGCLPMLLQMPILIAMYNFFPSSIELRQQSFLWAHDLSTYDAIISWNANIPLISSTLGNHLSLFTLLMTITNIISTKLNSSNTQMSSDQPGAGMMKWMMYLMPVMFLFMFNNYSSALSYYFFLSALITIIQTYAIRASIDEEKLLAKLHAKGKANEKKPKKKGGFMARLEKIQKEQEKMMREKNKRRK